MSGAAKLIHLSLSLMLLLLLLLLLLLVLLFFLPPYKRNHVFGKIQLSSFSPMLFLPPLPPQEFRVGEHMGNKKTKRIFLHTFAFFPLFCWAFFDNTMRDLFIGAQVGGLTIKTLPSTVFKTPLAFSLRPPPCRIP